MVAMRTRQSAAGASNAGPSPPQDVAPPSSGDSAARRRKRNHSASPNEQQTSPQSKRRNAPTTPAKVSVRDGNATASRSRRGRQTNEVADSQPITSEAVDPSANAEAPDNNNAANPTVAVQDLHNAAAEGYTGEEVALANDMSFNGTDNTAFPPRAQDEMRIFEAPDLLPQGPSIQVKTSSLPVLDNLVG